jgi:hypothetical protein
MADPWTSPYSDVWRSMLLLLFHGMFSAKKNHGSLHRPFLSYCPFMTYRELLNNDFLILFYVFRF